MKNILFILRTLLYGWLLAIGRLIMVLCRLLARWCRKLHMGRPGKVARSRCVPIDEPAFVRPDPLIYDEYYLMGLGLSVTWDNPDIQLYLNGAPVSSSLLEPATTYEIVARVWNSSLSAPVLNMPVHFSYLVFGIGTTSVPIGTTKINLGVKGGSNCPAFASFPWTTPAAPGHYCIQALLEPFHDLNCNNNLVQENTNVGKAHSPAIFTFPFLNNTSTTQRSRFEVDAYSPGVPDPCVNKTQPTSDGRRVVGTATIITNGRLDRHRRGRQPLLAGWQVNVTPESPSLAPRVAVTPTVTLPPPPWFSRPPHLNL